MLCHCWVVGVKVWYLCLHEAWVMNRCSESHCFDVHPVCIKPLFWHRLCADWFVCDCTPASLQQFSCEGATKAFLKVSLYMFFLFIDVAQECCFSYCKSHAVILDVLSRSVQAKRRFKSRILMRDMLTQRTCHEEMQDDRLLLHLQYFVRAYFSQIFAYCSAI